MEISQITYDFIANECSNLYTYLIDNHIIPNKNITDIVEKNRIAFYYYMMNKLSDIKYEDIANFALFDNAYLEKMYGVNWCDYGVDGCYISYDAKKVTFYNFKYWEKLKERQLVADLKSSKDFLDKIKSKDNNGLEGRILESYNRIRSIIDIKRTKWNFELLFITNDSVSLAKNATIIQEFKSQYNVDVKCISLNEIYNLIVSKAKKMVCSISTISSNLMKFKTLKNNSFLYKIDVLELFRMFCDNEEYRKKYDILPNDYQNIKNSKIDELALFDNPRGDLQNEKFIDSISKTLSNEPSMFFAYNNGITILTDGIKEESSSFGDERIIYTLEDAQIVNGGQTVRACAKAINSADNLDKIKDAYVLIRVFNVKSDDNASNEERKKQAELFRNIPKYTNKQVLISEKDLRAMDYVQFIIEKKLALHNIYYSRRTQKVISFDQNKYNSMIEMEKFGQIIYAKNGYPHQASNKKKLIFGSEYDNVFTPLIDNDDFYKVVNDYNNLKGTHKELSQQKIFYIIYIKYKLYNYVNYDDCINLLNDVVLSYVKLDNGAAMKESRKLIQQDFKKELDLAIEKRNKIDKFIYQIKSGFDVSFNYKDVFYTISLIDEDETGKKYGIGSDNGFTADFETLESIPDFVLDDKKIKDIVLDLNDEEIFH